MKKSSRALLVGSILLLAVVLMIVLRTVALDSDAYPRLSWSSALLTDEGFYIHDARNAALFGHPTDQFSNALIMPLLSALQTQVFRAIGTGAVQARSVSVVLGLLTLPVLLDALRRAFGMRAALLGTLLLGLDHVSLLYSRLALMDTPAAFVLVCAFWAWARSGEAGEGRERSVWLALCGSLLGLCWSVRGLGALAFAAPALLLGREAMRGSEEGGRGRSALAWLLAGLCVSLAVYVLAWQLPHRAELARVNHYYLFEQMMPHGFFAFVRNWQTGLFGDNRGLMPYLFRHQPIQTCLVLVWIVGRAFPGEGASVERSGIDVKAVRSSDYLGLWMVVFWILMCSIGYAPSRYYVLFLPAMAGLAGRTLSDIIYSWRCFMLIPIGVGIVSGLFSYHLFLSMLHHLGVGGTILPSLLGVLTGLTCHAMTRRKTFVPDFSKQPIRLPSAALFIWATVNLCWMGDWLGHLTYRQRDADRWLAANLPANSVLIGAVTPGLCLNNRFVCVNVIAKLCNDHQPVERYAPAPRYVIILDEKWREVWWQRNYPELLRPENRIHHFDGLLRPFFVIGVYKVNDKNYPAK